MYLLVIIRGKGIILTTFCIVLLRALKNILYSAKFWRGKTLAN